MSYFGYSQLALYNRCPKRFWYERVEQREENLQDGRAAFIGNVLGRAIAAFYTQRLWRTSNPRQSMILAIYAASDHVHKATVLPWQPGELDHALAICRDAVSPIFAVMREHKLIPPTMHIELPVEVPLDTGDTLVGTPDLVLVWPDKLWLLDVKGGGTIGRHVTADQLRLYQLGLLMHPAFKRLPDKVGFWWVRHGKIVWKRSPTGALAKWVAGAKATIARLRSGDFTPKPGDHCRYCPWRPECPAGTVGLQELKTRVPMDEALGRVSL